MPRAPLKVDELAIHRDPGRSLTGITWVEVDATPTITYVQTQIVAMPADAFFRDNAQLEVWTQIGFGIVNEFIGLLGGEPMSTPDGVGALLRHGRQLGGGIAVPYFVAQFVAHL